MSSIRYQYENLLRKPVEYYSAIAYLIATLIIFSLPNILLMPRGVAFIGGCLLFFRGIQRFVQAYKLHEYQRTLCRLGSFRTTPKPLMSVKQAQWLGLGFIWDGRHTQRLFDLEKPENRHLLVEKVLSKKAQKIVDWLDKKLPHPYRQSFELPLPEGGGRPEIHAIGLWEGEQDIGIFYSDHIGHSLILGNTRTGKTRLLEIELIQAIARQESVIIFDAKGDGDLLKRAYSQFKTLEEGHFFHYINFLDHAASHVIHWDPKFLDPKELVLHDAQKNELFALRFLYLISELIYALKKPIAELEAIYASPQQTLIDALKHYVEKNTQGQIEGSTAPEICMHYYQTPKIHHPTYNAVYYLLQTDTPHLNQILLQHKILIASIIHDDASKFFIYSPDQQSLSLPTYLSNKNSILYLCLYHKQASALPELYLRMIIQELTASLSRSAIKQAPTIIADEIGSLLKNQYLSMLSDIARVGMKASLYEQFMPKSPNPANNSTEYILSHFSQLIFFRHAEQSVCDFLMRRQKDVHVTTTDLISGTVDNSNIESNVTFTSSTTQRQTRQKTSLLSINDFVALPIGQAFGLLNGNQLIKLRMPLVTFLEEDFPPYISSAISQMKSLYQSTIHSGNPSINHNAHSQSSLINLDTMSGGTLIGMAHAGEESYLGIEDNELTPPTFEEEII